MKQKINSNAELTHNVQKAVDDGVWSGMGDCHPVDSGWKTILVGGANTSFVDGKLANVFRFVLMKQQRDGLLYLTKDPIAIKNQVRLFGQKAVIDEGKWFRS